MPIRGDPFVRNLQGNIQSVLVATWPDDEVELWRTGLVATEHPPLRIFRIVTGYPYESSSLKVGDVLFVFPKSESDDLHNWFCCLRWAATELGLVDRGQTPFPSNDADLTWYNPWIGTFVGRTRTDVALDAEWFDRLLVDHFEGNESTMSLWVPSVSNLHLETHRSLYPRGWDDRSILSKGSLLFEIEDDDPDREVSDPSKRQGPAGIYTMTVSRSRGSAASMIARHVPSRKLSGHTLSWLMDLTGHPSWAVLPKDDAERWWDDHVRVGRLAMDEDERQVYGLVGEPLPFVWESDKLRTWAETRWSTGGQVSPSHIPVPHRRHP